MQATQNVMASMGLVNGRASKRKPSNPKSEAQKLIPPKKGKGSRTAAEKQSIVWITAATESFSARHGEERKEIPSVVCLPCLDIKLEERSEKAMAISEPDFTRPPVSAPPVTNKTPVVDPSQNGVATNMPVLKSKTQDESDLDKDLVVWMKEGFSRYITLAGHKPNSDRIWGYRMAQIACGFDVMALGTKSTREFFPCFVGALFELLDGAKSTRDLDLLEYILKDSVYLDVLAEAAEFQTKNGAVSANFQNYFDDKYLTFTAADELLRGRSRS